MMFFAALSQYIPFIPPLILKLSIPVLAMLPFVEIGLAIPFGIMFAGVTPFEAAALALTGHIIAILIFAPIIFRYGRDLEKKFGKFRKMMEHAKNIKLDRFWGIRELGIIGFIALPLPVGGIWYAIPAAYIFNVPLRNTIISAIIGSVLGSIQFTLFWTGIFSLIKLWVLSELGGYF